MYSNFCNIWASFDVHQIQELSPCRNFNTNLQQDKIFAYCREARYIASALSYIMEYHNPVPTVDVIVQRDSKVLMIRRKKDPFKDQLALPGGFVNEGETVEEAMKREAKEELSLEVEPLDILGVYSDPGRDPRKHTLSVVFVGIIVSGQEKAGDDAAGIEWVEVASIEKQKLAFDHVRILRDYRQWKSSSGTFWSTKRRND
jgi:8-oxo-dGTP diphosphatase